MMNRTRKMLSVALIAVLLMSLASCGGKTPSKKVGSDIKEVQKAEISSKIFDSEDNGFTEEEKDGYSKFLKKLNDFDYEIGEEKVSEDGNSATVEVSIKTYDFGTAYLDAWDKIASGKVKHDTSFYTLFFDTASKLDEKNFVTKVTINCKKSDDGEWTTDLADNAEFKKAIFGDLIQVVSDLAEMN